MSLCTELEVVFLTSHDSRTPETLRVLLKCYSDSRELGTQHLFCDRNAYKTEEK